MNWNGQICWVSGFMDHIENDIGMILNSRNVKRWRGFMTSLVQFRNVGQRNPPGLNQFNDFLHDFHTLLVESEFVLLIEILYVVL